MMYGNEYRLHTRMWSKCALGKLRSIRASLIAYCKNHNASDPVYDAYHCVADWRIGRDDDGEVVIDTYLYGPSAMVDGERARAVSTVKRAANAIDRLLLHNDARCRKLFKDPATKAVWEQLLHAVTGSPAPSASAKLMNDVIGRPYNPIQSAAYKMLEQLEAQLKEKQKLELKALEDDEMKRHQAVMKEFDARKQALKEKHDAERKELLEKKRGIAASSGAGKGVA